MTNTDGNVEPKTLDEILDDIAYMSKSKAKQALGHHYYYLMLEVINDAENELNNVPYVPTNVLRRTLAQVFNIPKEG